MLLQQTYYSAEMDPGTPTAFKMKLFARIANDKTSLSIIAKCSMDLPMTTTNHNCLI